MSHAERTRLVEQHLPLVRNLAARMARRARPYLELDDLVAIGCEALLRASERFDVARSVSFGSFAYLRVRGAMCEGIGQVGPHRRGRYRRRPNRVGRPALPTICAFDDSRVPVGACASRRERQEELERSLDLSILGPRLRAAVGHLDGRSRELVERFYFGGETLCQIGREMGHTKSWASRLHARALDELRGVLSARSAISVGD